MDGVPSLPERLRSRFPEMKMETEASWQHRTTLGAGLAPFLLVHPGSVHELQALCRELSGKAEIRVLGAGSNVVGSDSPLPDTVFIRLDSPAFTRIKNAGGGLIECGAGVLLSNLASEAAKMDLGGISALSGIPGTIGGAIRMNAGAMGTEMSRIVRFVEGIDLRNGAIYISDFDARSKWGYRRSPVPGHVIITGAAVFLKKADSRRETELIAGERARRTAVTPHGRSAGSIFTNPGRNKAGILLEECGCKTLSSGAWKVSAAHANWIVSEQRGLPLSEKDFTDLAAEMHARVFSANGIALKPEVVFVNKSSRDQVENAKEPAAQK